MAPKDIVEFELRPAKAKDMASISKLIKELVQQESMPHGPKVTCADLVKDGFLTKGPLFRCIVAEICDGGPVIGYTIYYYFFSGRNGRGIKVDDMLVAREHRQHGIGKAMFNAICKQALQNECNCVEFQVLEWNPNRRFYKHLRAVDVTKNDKWTLYRLTGDAIIDAASAACTTES